MALGSSALTTTSQEASESEEEGCSKQYWDTQLAKMEKEVREGRAPMHLVTTAREMYVCFLEISQIRDAPQDRLPNQEGRESGDSSPNGSDDSTSTGSEEQDRQRQRKGWSKQDWNAYLAKLEMEVKEGYAPMDLLIKGWEIFACLPEQPDSEREAPQDRQLNQEGPKLGDAPLIGSELHNVAHPPYQARPGMASSSFTSTKTYQPVTELENATQVRPERQEAWTIHDWEAHRAKVENHEVWLQQAARQLSAQGNAILSGSEQQGEWSRQDSEAHFEKLERHVHEGRAPMKLLTISQDMYMGAVQSLEIKMVDRSDHQTRKCRS